MLLCNSIEVKVMYAPRSGNGVAYELFKFGANLEPAMVVLCPDSVLTYVSILFCLLWTTISFGPRFNGIRCVASNK